MFLYYKCLGHFFFKLKGAIKICVMHKIKKSLLGSEVDGAQGNYCQVKVYGIRLHRLQTAFGTSSSTFTLNLSTSSILLY